MTNAPYPYPSLRERLDNYDPAVRPRFNDYCWFVQDGGDARRQSLDLYVRTGVLSDTKPFGFTISNIKLKGDAVQDPPLTVESLMGTPLPMHGSGLFRALFQYLLVRLPELGFRILEFETVSNDTLADVLVRYGCTRVSGKRGHQTLMLSLHGSP